MDSLTRTEITQQTGADRLYSLPDLNLPAEADEPPAAERYFNNTWDYLVSQADVLQIEDDPESPQEQLARERRKLFKQIPRLLDADRKEREWKEILEALVDQPVTIHETTYRLHRLLGRGGSGAVFEAGIEGQAGSVVVKFGQPIDRTMAMKPNPMNYEDSSRVMEARSCIIELASLFKLTGKKPLSNNLPFARYVDAQYLSNPDSLTALVAEQIVVIVQEMIQGETLYKIIKDKQLVPDQPDTILNYSQQLLSAVEIMHAAGVLHLDLKPLNILMQSDGQLKLIDFGAGYLHDHVQRQVAWAQRLNSQFTPVYTRREELGTFTQARDAYATGVTINDMIYGLSITPEIRTTAYPTLPHKLQILSDVADLLTNPEPTERLTISAAKSALQDRIAGILQ